MESVLRGFAVYFALLIIVRLSGLRTMAEMTPFDFVLVLVISETTQQAILGDDFSVTNAVLLMMTLFMANITLSYVKRWSPRIGRIMDGVPIILVVDGVPHRTHLKGARLDVEDVLEAARKQGTEHLHDIRFAILEAGGDISIIEKEKN